MTRLEPVHPGEILEHDFMEPLALSSTALAKAIGVTPARINEIVRRRRGRHRGARAPLHDAAGDRGRVHPRRAEALHVVRRLLPAPEGVRRRPARGAEEGGPARSRASCGCIRTTSRRRRK